MMAPTTKSETKNILEHVLTNIFQFSWNEAMSVWDFLLTMIVLVRHLTNCFRQRFISTPETWAGVVNHNFLDLPSRCAASARIGTGIKSSWFGITCYLFVPRVWIKFLIPRAKYSELIGRQLSDCVFYIFDCICHFSHISFFEPSTLWLPRELASSIVG